MYDNLIHFYSLVQLFERTNVCHYYSRIISYKNVEHVDNQFILSLD